MGSDNIIFEGPKIPDRGYVCRATDKKDGSGNATIEIIKDGGTVRTFDFPAYKVWNIAAHFSDIVDSEIAGNTNGHQLAAWNGLPQVAAAEGRVQ